MTILQPHNIIALMPRIERTSRGFEMEIAISRAAGGKSAIITCPPGKEGLQATTSELKLLAALDPTNFTPNGNYKHGGWGKLAESLHKSTSTLQVTLRHVRERNERRSGHWSEALALRQELEKLGLLDEETLNVIQQVTQEGKVRQRVNYSE